MIYYKMEQTNLFCPLCGRKDKESLLKFYKFPEGDEIGFCANPICCYNTKYDIKCRTPPSSTIKVLNPQDLMATFIIGEAICCNKIPVLRYLLCRINVNKTLINQSYHSMRDRDEEILKEFYEKVLEKRKFNWLADYPTIPKNIIIKNADISVDTHISELKSDQICLANVVKYTKYLIEHNIALDEDTFRITIVHLMEAHTLIQIKCNIFLSRKLQLRNELHKYISNIQALGKNIDTEYCNKYIACHDVYKANTDLEKQCHIKLKELEAFDELNITSKSCDRPNFSNNNNDVLNVDNKSCTTNKYKQRFDGFADKINKVENCHDRLRFINKWLKNEITEFSDSVDELNITADSKIMTNSGDKLNNNVSSHEQYVNENFSDKQNTLNNDDKLNINNPTNQLNIIGRATNEVTSTFSSGNPLDMCNNSKDIQNITDNTIDKPNTTSPPTLAYKIDIIGNTIDVRNMTENSADQIIVCDTSIGNLNIIDSSSRQQNNIENYTKKLNVERNISVDTSHNKPPITTKLTKIKELIVFNASHKKYNIIKNTRKKPNPSEMINITDKITGKPNIFNIPAANLRVVKDPAGIQRILIEGNFSNVTSKPNITCNSTRKLNVINGSVGTKRPTTADSLTLNVNNNKAAIPNIIGNFNNPLIINNGSDKLKKIPGNSAKNLKICKPRGTLNNVILKRPITNGNSNKFIIIDNPNKKLKLSDKSASNEPNIITSRNSTKKFGYSFNMQNNTGSKQNGIEIPHFRDNITNNNNDAKFGIHDGHNELNNPAPKQLTPAEELQAILRTATKLSAEKIENGYYCTNMNAIPKKAKRKSNTMFKSKANPTNTGTHNSLIQIPDAQMSSPIYKYDEVIDLCEEEICDSLVLPQPTKLKKKRKRMQPISDALSKSIDRILENTRRKIMGKQKDIPTVVEIEDDSILPEEIKPVSQVKNIPDLKTPSMTCTPATTEVLETIDDTKVSVLSDDFLTSLLE